MSTSIPSDEQVFQVNDWIERHGEDYPDGFEMAIAIAEKFGWWDVDPELGVPICPAWIQDMTEDSIYGI